MNDSAIVGIGFIILALIVLGTLMGVGDKNG